MKNSIFHGKIQRCSHKITNLLPEIPTFSLAFHDVSPSRNGSRLASPLPSAPSASKSHAKRRRPQLRSQLEWGPGPLGAGAMLGTNEFSVGLWVSLWFLMVVFWMKFHLKYTGWWYTYPSEQYESQLGLLFPIYGKNPNHQSEYVNHL